MRIDFDKLLSDAIRYQKEDHTGSKSGVQGLDNIFTLERGDFVALCGAPNDGKSTFIQWYLCKLAVNSGWKTTYLNFEGKQEETFLQILTFFGDVEQMKKHVGFSEIENLNSINQVIEDIEKEKDTENIDCYVIDPYSNLLLGNVDTYTIAQDLAKLQAIGRLLKVTIILLCHPPKMAEEITIYNIKGSSSFAERVDVGLSLKREYEQNTTTIKVDKLRANGLRGKVKGECTLKYKYSGFIEIEKNDFPFCKLDEQKEIETQEKPNINTILKDSLKRAEMPFRDVSNIMLDNYTTIQHKTPDARLKLFESVNRINDAKVKDQIQKIRATENKEERKLLKQNLPIVMPSVSCGKSKDEIKQYHNIICVDIDQQDNIKLSLEQIKERTNTFPYVFYSAVSCSGKGLFALIYIDGGIDDFKPHFYAIEKDFTDMGITIDSQCKNPNRVRFVTVDEKPYYNEHALIYTNKQIQISNTVTKSVSTNEIDLNADKKKVLELLQRCKEENLIINPTHADTCKLMLVISHYFGEEGFDLFMDFQRIKHKGYVDENKYYSTFISDVEKECKMSYGTLHYLYNNAKEIIK